MKEGFDLCLEIIENVENFLKEGRDYKDIIEYLETKKTVVEKSKDEYRDESADYIDKLVKKLK